MGSQIAQRYKKVYAKSVAREKKGKIPIGKAIEDYAEGVARTAAEERISPRRRPWQNDPAQRGP